MSAVKPHAVDPSTITDKSRPWMPVVTAVLIASGFTFDVMTPRGTADWIIYIAPIVLGSRFGPRKLPFYLAGVCSLLMYPGFLLSHPGGVSLTIALTNRTLALLTVWLTALVVYRTRSYELALMSSVEQLRHADRLKTMGMLASGVAHELGTPLNVVMGTADFLRTAELTREQVHENAAIILDQSARITALIRQLLQFTRLRALTKAPMDLREVARLTLDFMEPMIKKQNVSVPLTLGKDPLIATIDSVQIQQVLANLLMNAIQASPRDAKIEIDVRRAAMADPVQSGSFATITVTDYGEGMAQDVQSRIFEPFFTTKEVGTGTGLGLSIVQGIVAEHGGWISVDSEPHKGSIFTVYLPVEEK